MRKPLNLLLFAITSTVFTTSYATDLKTYQVRSVETEQEQVLDATIEAAKQSTVSSQISGRITNIYFDVDDLVKKGDVLLKVRDAEYKARLQKAAASLEEAKATVRDAQTEFNRAKDMIKKHVISESQYDRADATLKGAQARVLAAKAAVAEAREQLANTTVKAPYSGVVTIRHVELGETVNPGKPLMTGISLDKLRAVIEVPQTFINAIRLNKTARVILDSGKSIDSRSLLIFPYADPIHHTFKVRIGLPEDTGNIYPGMFVKAAFVVSKTQRLMIPEESLVHRSEVTAVYVVEPDGKVKMRQVRTGYHNNHLIEILAGLDVNETIALNPVEAGIVLKNQTGAK